MNNIDRDAATGRLILPALWRKEVEHLLSPNYNLAVSIAKSQRKRLSMSKLLEYDSVIREQTNSGVIERVDSSRDRSDPKVSFLPHSAVFKESVNSTKCRVVFLSNLKEGNTSNYLSRNQISRTGVNLNHKLQIALLLLRFDKYLLTYDLIGRHFCSFCCTRRIH